MLNLRRPVSSVPPLDEFDLRLVNDRELEVEIHRDQDLNDLFAALSAAGIEVASMRNKTNRLEELFVRLIQRREQDRLHQDTPEVRL